MTDSFGIVSGEAGRDFEEMKDDVELTEFKRSGTHHQEEGTHKAQDDLENTPVERTKTPLERTRVPTEKVISPFIFGYLGFITVIAMFVAMIAAHYISDVILSHRYENFQGGFTFWGNVAQFLGCVFAFVMQLYKIRLISLLYIGVFGRIIASLVFGIFTVILGYRSMYYYSPETKMVQIGGSTTGELGYLILLTFLFALSGISSACLNQLAIAGAVGMKEFQYSGAWSVGNGIANLSGFLVSIIPLTDVNKKKGEVSPITHYALWLLFAYFAIVSGLFIVGHILCIKQFWEEPGIRNLLEVGDWEGKQDGTPPNTSPVQNLDRKSDVSPKKTVGSDASSSSLSSSRPNPKNDVDEKSPLVGPEENSSANEDVEKKNADNSDKVTWFKAFCACWPLMASMVIAVANQWALFPVTITAIKSKKKAEEETKLLLAQEETQALLNPETGRKEKTKALLNPETEGSSKTESSNEANVDLDLHENPESNKKCCNVFTAIVMFGGNQYVILVVSILRAAIFLPLFLYMPTIADPPPGSKDPQSDIWQWFLYQDALKIILVILFFFMQGWISTGVYHVSTKTGRNGDERSMAGAFVAFSIAFGLVLGSTIAILITGAFVKAVTFSKTSTRSSVLGLGELQIGNVAQATSYTAQASSFLESSFK